MVFIRPFSPSTVCSCAGPAGAAEVEVVAEVPEVVAEVRGVLLEPLLGETPELWVAVTLLSEPPKSRTAPTTNATIIPPTTNTPSTIHNAPELPLVACVLAGKGVA